MPQVTQQVYEWQKPDWDRALSTHSDVRPVSVLPLRAAVESVYIAPTYGMYTHVNPQTHGARPQLCSPCTLPRPLLLRAAALTLLLCPCPAPPEPSKQTRYLGQDRCVAWSHPDRCEHSQLKWVCF